MIQTDLNNRNVFDLPFLGLGLGLRNVHFDYILENTPAVNWFEIISENFMNSGGRPRDILNQIKELYPLVMHGVSLSIGSTDPLNFDYLQRLKKLADEINPVWISDHLCWTGVLSINSHDLLPLPLNEESLHHVAKRVRTVQEYLERPLILENPSTYISFQSSDMTEWDFLRSLTEETDCGLLLDVNNVYVSSFNNEFDPVEYLNNIPFDRVVQLHLAGHQHCGNCIIDTHDRQVSEETWELFRLAWKLSSGVTTLLEWDGAIPPFEEYLAELHKAEYFMDGNLQGIQAKPNRRYQEPSIVIPTPLDHLIPAKTGNFDQ